MIMYSIGNEIPETGSKNGTEESFACVDIGGYNYMAARYEKDGQLFPNRIICGSETLSPDIDINWKLVKANGHVIGDFTWTGWDYIGEAGVGRVDYTMFDSNGICGAYPWYLAYVGASKRALYRGAAARALWKAVY